jgi:glucose dehydrogenase
MKRFYILFAFVLILTAGLTVAAQSQAPFVPVTDEMLWKPNPADWLMWRRTLDSWGYSPLNEVNRNNVSRLKMMWTRGIGTGRTQEATPLVYNGTMYIPNPGDVIMAMDAKTGDLKWEYRRKYPEGVNGGTNGTWRSGARLTSTRRRQHHLRRRRTYGQPGVGNASARREETRERQLGTHHRQRQGHHRPPVPA